MEVGDLPAPIIPFGDVAWFQSRAIRQISLSIKEMFDVDGHEVIEILRMICFPADRLPSAIIVMDQNANRAFVIQHMGANDAYTCGHSEA
jgi:hypothetical protein